MNARIFAAASALMAAVACTHAFAKGDDGDKSVSWPLEEYVLQNVLDSQKDCGGWGKNIDKRRQFDEKRRSKVVAEKGDAESATIDNNATTTEIRYLLRYHAKNKDAASLDAARRGLEWVLSSQLANGGWAMGGIQPVSVCGNGSILRISHFISINSFIC